MPSLMASVLITRSWPARCGTMRGVVLKAEGALACQWREKAGNDVELVHRKRITKPSDGREIFCLLSSSAERCGQGARERSRDELRGPNSRA